MPVSVNGEILSADCITSECDRLRQYYQQYAAQHNVSADEKELRRWAVENCIEQSLLRQEALNSISPPPKSEIDAAFAQYNNNSTHLSEEAARQELKTHLMIEKLINAVTRDAPEPSDEEIRQYYQDNKERFKLPEQVHASHIVKHVAAPADEPAAREAMQAVEAELAGGVPFENLARAHSDCPDDAGDLGFFPRGRMVQEFEDVVFSLQPGQVSPVFSSSFGYHIAKVHERRPAGTASLNEVRGYIKKELSRQRCQLLLEQHVDSLKSQADIVRDDD